MLLPIGNSQKDRNAFPSMDFAGCGTSKYQLAQKLHLYFIKNFQNLEMMRMRKFFISLILLSATAVNTGCVGIFAVGVVTGAGQYIKYSIDCVASHTFMGDLQHVTSASIDALKEMKIQIDTVEQY